MLFELMHDDRFLMKHDRCWQVLRDEHRYLEQAPNYFSATVSAILSVDCDWYMTSVLERSVTSVADLRVDRFGPPLAEAPLKYVIGDTKAIIELLMREESVAHPLAVKWKALAILGFGGRGCCRHGFIRRDRLFDNPS